MFFYIWYDLLYWLAVANKRSKKIVFLNVGSVIAYYLGVRWLSVSSSLKAPSSYQSVKNSGLFNKSLYSTFIERINLMQVTANSQLQMQAYNNMQQSKPALEQSASNKTLQSDTVSISQEALAAAGGAEIQRGGGVILPPDRRPK